MTTGQPASQSSGGLGIPPDSGVGVPPARGVAVPPVRGGERSDPGTKPRVERPSLRTLVIIPTFNERDNLPLILGRVHKARPDVHVLIVDDSSPDGTGELADEMSLADPDRVHVMHRTAKDGLGAAYLAGFE